jgi:glycosyltransferase 2 family protein
MMSGSSQKLRIWASRGLFIMVLLAVGWVIARNIHQLDHQTIDFRWQLLLASVGLVLSAFIIQLITWQLIASSFGIKTQFIQSANAWFMSRLGRYVPGKITILLMRINLYRGESKRKITAATAIEQVASMASACLLILISILFYPHHLSGSLRLFALIGSVIFLILLWPGLFVYPINFGFRLIKKAPLHEIPSYSFLLLTVGLYLISSIIHGAAFYMLLNAASPIQFRFLLPISAAYYCASLIGLLAIFAPGGIGVREGVLLVILPLLIPMHVAIFGTLVIRIVTTVSELIAASVFFVLEKVWKSHSRNNQNV